MAVGQKQRDYGYFLPSERDRHEAKQDAPDTALAACPSCDDRLKSPSTYGPMKVAESGWQT